MGGPYWGESRLAARFALAHYGAKPEMPLPHPTPARQLGSASLRYAPGIAGLAWPRSGLREPGRGTGASRGATWLVGPRDGETAASRGDRLARVEAVLLLAREPLNLRRIAHLAGLADATEARTLIRRLNEGYDGGGRAFRVEEVAGGWQLLTRRKFGGWLRRLFDIPVQTRLSSPALETLAVIAYRQPVLRADIEAVRGVQCGEMLRQLMERDLVRIVGRAEELGRPFLYGTTRRFLQVFGLRRLEDLPRAAELRASPPPAAATVIPSNQLPGAGRNDEPPSPEESKEEQAVSIATEMEMPTPETLEEERLPLPGVIRAADEEDDEYEYDDEEDEDEEEDEDDDEDLDDDFEDEEWEEVDDDELDEDDEEWDDEEDEDWDEDEDEDEDDDEDDWEEEEEEE